MTKTTATSSPLLVLLQSIFLSFPKASSLLVPELSPARTDPVGVRVYSNPSCCPQPILPSDVWSSSTGVIYSLHWSFRHRLSLFHFLSDNTDLSGPEFPYPRKHSAYPDCLHDFTSTVTPPSFLCIDQTDRDFVYRTLLFIVDELHHRGPVWVQSLDLPSPCKNLLHLRELPKRPHGLQRPWSTQSVKSSTYVKTTQLSGSVSFLTPVDVKTTTDKSCLQVVTRGEFSSHQDKIVASRVCTDPSTVEGTH